MSRFIREETRPNAPSTVTALGSGVGGSGGGSPVTIPQRTIITPRGGEVCHLNVRGGKILDPFTAGINQLSGWTENGSVPRVAAAVPQGCVGSYLVEGLGPFSGVNFLSSGSLTAFQGDFTVCVILGNYASDSSNRGVIGMVGGGQTRGWLLYTTDNTAIARAAFFGDGLLSTAGAGGPPIFQVLLMGRAGGTAFAQASGEAVATTGSITGGYAPPQPGDVAILGKQPDGNNPFLGVFYEAWLSTLTPTQPLFTSILQEVHGKLGVVSVW